MLAQNIQDKFIFEKITLSVKKKTYCDPSLKNVYIQKSRTL